MEQKLEKDIIDLTTTEILDSTTGANIDPTPGNVLTDIALEGLSKQISDASSEGVDAENAIALDQAQNLSVADVDAKAKNFNTDRDPAEYATGSVVFYRRYAPVATYTIPVGTRVTTIPDKSGKYVSFVTTEVGQITTSTAINRLTSRYEVTVSVVAEIIGLAGTAGRNSVVRIPTAISGIDGVVNIEAISSGATDVETNIDLTNRIRTTKTSKSNIGTRPGYRTTILDYLPSVVDVDVVGPQDSANTRAEFGNEIDIYILGQNPTSFVDVVNFIGVTFTYLETRPVLSLSSVAGTTNGITYTNGSQWVFYQDTSGGYGYSTKSLDAIMWVSGLPSTGTSLTVSGTYDKNVVDAQSYLTEASRRVVVTNLLVKDGQKVLIDINTNIAVFSGYNRSTIVTNVKTAITNYIDGLGLGDRVEQADLVGIIASVEGVDKVQIPFTTLKKSTEVAGTVHDIALSGSQYPRTNLATLTVGVL